MVLYFAIYRLKELRSENDRLEGRATAAERNATSLDAQRKTAVADKAKFQKRVCIRMNERVLYLASTISPYFFDYCL